MKQLALCLAPLVMLVACSLDASDATDDDPPAASAAPAASTSSDALGGGGNPFAPCTPGSQGICPGQILGTVCASNPTQFCLPVQGQGNLCRCAAR
ncbi:MAG TPA: hypothetical protein VHT91_42400 [Kofleriaceae bacterium]|jgi:hypothetical protein|nr:hypothetical protein [Kofleriaceae bacterium]